MLQEGKGMGNLRLVIPGIPGNHIKSKVKLKIWFIFMPWPAIRKTENNDGISRLNSRPKLPFPGNGKGNYKMPREGKGNLRLVFLGITGNGNSRSPLIARSLFYTLHQPYLHCIEGSGHGLFVWLLRFICLVQELCSLRGLSWVALNLQEWSWVTGVTSCFGWQNIRTRCMWS